MTRVIFVRPGGERVEVEAQEGMSLMEVAVANGVPEIVAECGGACACGTCHCFVAGEWVDRLPPKEDMEAAMLDCVIDPRPQSRLSCQIRISDEIDGLVVEVPESQY